MLAATSSAGIRLPFCRPIEPEGAFCKPAEDNINAPRAC
ncbi:hypothetical protein CyaNS01_01821 [Cyanobium sp. NS01]|nr:hypothetical protein CyaNS01_01821 [Cyanobium sp. NS01]